MRGNRYHRGVIKFQKGGAITPPTNHTILIISQFAIFVILHLIDLLRTKEVPKKELLPTFLYRKNEEKW
jgi:hypothetical protein